MKKLNFFIPLFLLLFFIMPNYASPNIIVTPEKCLINNSVYVIFEWRAPYNVEDFNVTVSSDAVVFKNSTLYYAGVAEDARILHIFKGQAIKPGNHEIYVLMSYYYGGLTIKKEYLLNISILTLPETRINSTNTYSVSNITNITNETVLNITNISLINISSNNLQNATLINETTVNNTAINKTANITQNISIQNLNLNNNSIGPKNTTSVNPSSQITQNNQNWMMYGILGLIIGVAFGFVVMYIIKI